MREMKNERHPLPPLEFRYVYRPPPPPTTPKIKINKCKFFLKSEHANALVKSQHFPVISVYMSTSCSVYLTLHTTLNHNAFSRSRNCNNKNAAHTHAITYSNILWMIAKHVSSHNHMMPNNKVDEFEDNHQSTLDNSTSQLTNQEQTKRSLCY